MTTLPGLGLKLPASWGVATLSEVTSKIGSGATPRGGRSVYVPSGPALIRSQNIHDHEFKPEGLAFLSREAATALRGVTVETGDVLINITGDSILRTVVVPEAVLPARVNQHVAIVRSNGKIDPGFLQKWLSLPLMKDYMLGHSSGGTRKAITKGHLQSFPVPLPPFEEQRAIAAALGALDDKIESNRRVIELMVELVRARFAGDFDVDQADDGVAIGEIVDINSRRKLARGEETTYVSMSSLPEFSPAILEWEKRAFGSGQKFVNGDVLMARITPCLENGKTAVVDMLDDGEVGWGSTEYVVLSPRGAFSTPWVYALTRHETIRDWAIGRMTGTSGRQRFQASGFHEYRIQEPDPAVLAAFNDFAVPMFCKVSQARDEIKLLEQLRDALLPALLSGRIRVPNEGVTA